MKLPKGHITADELPDMVCRVCHTTLDVGVSYHGDVMTDFSFNHPPAYEVLGFPPHEPEPMLADAFTERTGICDFCSETTPMWRYSVRDFNVEFAPANMVSVSVGDWAACDQCHKLIEADNYRELCERALRRQLKIMQKQTGTQSSVVTFKLRKYVKGLHQRFKENRIGPAIYEGEWR